MAYRTDIGTRDRGGAIIAVIAVHVALLFVLLRLSGPAALVESQPVMRLFNLDRTPPRPPPLEQPAAKPKEKEGGSAPKNIRSEATPVVAPKPRIETPPVQQIPAAEIPRQGSESTQGASDVRGPGTGAGGVGNGNGSGNGGTGAGGGGVAEPPHLASPVLRGSDFPRELLDLWPRGATVFLRLRVDPRGLVGECLVDRGTGVPEIDSVMCNLAHERLRFRPALNARGQPVAGWFGYAQPAPR